MPRWSPRWRPRGRGRRRERRAWCSGRNGPPAGAHRPRRTRWRGRPRTRICSTGRRGRQADGGAGVRGRAAGSGSSDPDDVRLRVAHGTHPDLTWVRPSGAHVMRVDDVDEPVVMAATRTPFEASRRVFVLERVDTMNDEVANRLLKTLEEPAPFVHLDPADGRPGPRDRDRGVALPAGALRAAAGRADRGAAGGGGRAG